MSYLGTKPANQITDSTLIADGTVTPADLSTGKPVWDTSGNVGIGTSSPAFVNGTNGLQVNGSTAPAIRVTSPTSSLEFVSATSASYVYATSNIPLIFGTNNTERMRIDSSGNLLVGTTANGVSGWAVGKSIILSNNYSATGAFSVNSTNTSGNQYFFGFGVGGTLVGQIASNTSGTSYVTTSDYRLKENVAPMTGALAKVQALKPCTYTWKSTGEAAQGFIAHELQEICPDAVVGEKDAVDAEGNPVYQGIDTSFLVATLTAAIQELNAKVDSLQAELATLKGAE